MVTAPAGSCPPDALIREGGAQIHPGQQLSQDPLVHHLPSGSEGSPQVGELHHTRGLTCEVLLRVNHLLRRLGRALKRLVYRLEAAFQIQPEDEIGPGAELPAEGPLDHLGSSYCRRGAGEFPRLGLEQVRRQGLLLGGRES